MFYPGDAVVLGRMVDDLLSAVDGEGHGIGMPVALIVPHAGYIYSGPVAATAYATLAAWRERIDRVVVVGPPHRSPVHGLGVSSADGFETPLGVVPVDVAGRHALLANPLVAFDDRAHRTEHSIEVHLPFLQRILGDGWSLIPLLAGQADAKAVADALDELWGAPRTLVVVSTDLSHYHHQRTAQRLDQRTATAIVARRWEDLGIEDACGAVPVRGALELARRHGNDVELVDLRTSADTSGPVDRVVGYGSFVVR
jgi:hypothetical protein